MSEWTAGYVTDIAYTYGYYTELNPLRMKFSFLFEGLVVPEISTACELGFGQGLSVNLHAAASTAQWYGTDFNPSQAGFAQELAAASGAQLYDQAFEDFAARADLPDFDFIGVHGIWSWISDDNRAVIADFVRRKLKVGGVLYISYNTLPGWAAFAPIRHLMNEHSEILGSEGRGIVSRIDGAIEFAEKLMATEPVFSKANPLIGDRLARMKEHNRHYLAHEYFNQDWHPMHFAAMARWLDRAKLQYACSADLISHIDGVNLTVDQRKFLEDIPDRMFRETTRDFMVNQQFRRDYWVKGARKLSPLVQFEAMRAQRVLLVAPRSEISLTGQGSIGEFQMHDQIYTPILDVLADHKIKSLGQIEQAVEGKGVSFLQVGEAVTLLTGLGHLALVQDEATIVKARKRTDKLNAAICQKARDSGDIGWLASPVTGGGVAVNRFEQLFIALMAQGRKQPGEWAQTVWQLLSAQGQALVKDGAVIETEEGNLAQLRLMADEFITKRLPILKALQIV